MTLGIFIHSDYRTVVRFYKGTLVNYTLFGNCQAAALRWILESSNEFNNHFNYTELAPSYTLNEELMCDFVKNILPSIDFLLLQPHTQRLSKYHDSQFLIAECTRLGVKTLVFPQVYFTTYNPFEKALEITTRDSDHPNFLYSDTLMLNAILKNVSFGGFMDVVKKPSVEIGGVLDREHLFCYQYFLDIENCRNCDVCVSDSLFSGFSVNRLMHNNNHPLPAVMNDIASKILSLLGFSPIVYEHDMFDNHDSVVYPFIVDHWGMKFEPTDPEIIYARYKWYQEFIASIYLNKNEFKRFDETVQSYDLGIFNCKGKV